jgi:alkaline phosphatase
MKNTKLIIHFFSALCIVLSSFAGSKNGDAILIHSHNDYAQAKPFWGAYEAGADAIEVDVFLENGQLLVSHDRRTLRKAKTIQEMYLNPLRQVMRKNGGKCRANGKSLQLVVDLKTGKAALDKLVEIIEKEGYKECFDVKKNQFAARLVIGGDVSKIENFLDYPEYVFFSVKASFDFSRPCASRVWEVSESLRTYSRWRKGRMSEKDKKRIRSAAELFRTKGVKLRIWAIPDNKEAWALAKELGLDYINTDRPAIVAKWLSRK